MPLGLQVGTRGVPSGGYFSQFLDAAAATADQAFIAADTATPNRRIVVHAVFASVQTAAGTFFFESGTALQISPTFTAPVNGPLILPFNPAGWFSTARGAALTVTTAGAGAVPGIIVVYSVQ